MAYFDDYLHNISHMRKRRPIRWELILVLAVNFAVWAVIIAGIEHLISRSPFG